MRLVLPLYLFSVSNPHRRVSTFQVKTFGNRVRYTSVPRVDELETVLVTRRRREVDLQEPLKLKLGPVRVLQRYNLHPRPGL